MNCPNCGVALGPNARFCTECGTSIPATMSAQPPPSASSMSGGAGGPSSGYARPSEYGGAAGQMDLVSDPGSFFSALFDFSFSEFITTRIIKVLYILSIIGIALISLVILISSFTQGAGAGILGLIFAIIFFFLYVILARVWMELIIVIFRIAEYARDIARNSRR
jgi:hypothetical protein